MRLPCLQPNTKLQSLAIICYDRESLNLLTKDLVHFQMRISSGGRYASLKEVAKDILDRNVSFGNLCRYWVLNTCHKRFSNSCGALSTSAKIIVPIG